MKSSKTTRRALLGSLTSLLLCFAMLIGSTFAWFTDTASTSVNKIEAGTLKVELQMKDAQGNWVDAEGQTLSWEKADNGSEVLWEPGATFKTNEFRVINKGNLALTYKFVISGIGGDEGLNKVIDWKYDYVFANGSSTSYPLTNLASAETALAPSGSTLGNFEAEGFRIVGTMSEEAGNEYQGASISNIAVTVIAKQRTAEYDSNNNQYDKDAKFPEVKTAATNEEFKTALTENKENITVVLTSDVTIDVAAWTALPFGGATTKSITIDGAGHTLTFNNTNNDWNNIATNNGATLILKNLKLTNSGHNDGPWNRHDLNFACPVVMENVTSDKAIALQKDSTLKNVTINESGEVYYLWITADGQTVTLDDVTINASENNGRAIAIKDEYVANPAKVTLNIEDSTIKSAKKAAVLVTSTAGADITAENVNISGVTADTINLAWIDEACPNAPVTVTGGSYITES